jgi:hypothetical protein
MAEHAQIDVRKGNKVVRIHSGWGIPRNVLAALREAGRYEGYSAQLAEANKEERRAVYEKVLDAFKNEDGNSKRLCSDVVRSLAAKEEIALTSFLRKPSSGKSSA